MEGGAQPVCYSIPVNPQIPAKSTSTKHQLHGADDLITLFELKPLWEKSVKPYTAASRTKQKEQADNTIKEERKGSEPASEPNGKPADAGPSGTSDVGKPLVMEKTYVNYVRDLPGQVRPPKRTVSKYNSAMVAASSSGALMPSLPPEITGRTTMRDIVFRPETTLQRIAPFDEESLRSAFTVEAGPIADIDLSLLESDEVDKQSPNKKKKKRKHQRDNTGDKNEERGKSNAVVRR